MRGLFLSAAVLLLLVGCTASSVGSKKKKDAEVGEANDNGFTFGSDNGAPDAGGGEDPGGTTAEDPGGTVTGEDPGGTTGDVCVADCAGKVCGDDGCGGQCGTCDAGDSCNAVGQCECIPACGVKVCGSDGCGGECGQCADNEFCNAVGQCACTPACTDKNCGDDGCGGNCGLCVGSATCSDLGVCECIPDCTDPCAADDGCGTPCNACEGAFETCVEGKCALSKAFGGFCSQFEGCTPNDEAAWPACVHAQCDEGWCLAPVCTRACTVYKDTTDWQGNPVPDGVQDADAPQNDCIGAIDGPGGAQFNCVLLVEGVSLCVAGDTFKPCNTSVDCPGEQICTLQFIGGVVGAFCAPGVTDGAQVGETCNENDALGDTDFCQNGYCTGSLGCLGFCGSDSECLTPDAACVEGHCKNAPEISCEADVDCSAYFCQADTVISSDPAVDTYGVCFGKPCANNAGCAGDDMRCLFSTATAPDGLPVVQNICAPPPALATGLGGDCVPDSEITPESPGCGAGPCLNSGKCSAMCVDQADCEGGLTPALCGAGTATYDTNGDLEDDLVLPVPLCFPYQGTGAPCISNAECGDLERCTWFSVLNEAGEFDAALRCTAYAEGAGDLGASCATADECKGGVCLGADDEAGVLGFCSVLCGAKADCGPNSTFDGQAGFVGEVTWICQALTVGTGLDLLSDTDNVLLPVCVALEGAASLTPCSPDAPECPVGEACTAVPITLGSDAPVAAEYLCQGIGEASKSYGDAPPCGEGALACTSGYCSAANGCTKLCATDTDCGPENPDWTCQDQVFLARPTPENALTIPICLP